MAVVDGVSAAAGGGRGRGGHGSPAGGARSAADPPRKRTVLKIITLNGLGFVRAQTLSKISHSATDGIAL